MINKKEYPLAQIQNIEALHNTVRDFVKANSGVIEIIKDENLELVIRDFEYGSKFKFSVSVLKYDRPVSLYSVEFNPANPTVLTSKKKICASEDVLKLLSRWFGLIREYNKVALTQEEKIFSEYEREFFNNLKLVDEDADTNTYELEKQFIIDTYLSHAIEVLELHEGDNQVLIDEAKNLKDNLSRWTKGETIKMMSRFFANVRIKSLPLLRDLLIRAKVELFERIVDGTFDKIGDIVENIGD